MARYDRPRAIDQDWRSEAELPDHRGQHLDLRRRMLPRMRHPVVNRHTAKSVACARPCQPAPPLSRQPRSAASTASTLVFEPVASARSRPVFPRMRFDGMGPAVGGPWFRPTSTERRLSTFELFASKQMRDIRNGAALAHLCKNLGKIVIKHWPRRRLIQAQARKAGKMPPRSLTNSRRSAGPRFGDFER
jgi:hypothetical protein